MGTYCVTGAASGIGKATTQRLEADGHHVIGVDLAGVQVTADLSTPEGRAHAVAAVLDASGGRLDGLVPCAGVNGATPGSTELTVRLNYFGVMAMVDGLHEALAAGTDPALVVISSNSTTMTPGIPLELVDTFLAGDEDAAVAQVLALADAGTWLAYPIGKLALAYWVRANAVQPEWIGRGIRVNAVAPGVTETNMVRQLADLPGMSAALDSIPIPQGRRGRPEDIAGVVAFLLGPDSAYIVGQTVFVDGGTDAVIQPRSHPHPL